MDYTAADIPLELKHGEYLTLPDGSSLYWETNGEAKDVFLGSGFAPDVELFPENSWEFASGDARYRLTARFEDVLVVERI
ncbi:hypothetical protein [Megalodesulfovibrio paquesii]